MSYAVAVSGRIASGKSTISRCLAERLASPLVSFGDLVRVEAASRNLPLTRETLQDLGQSMLNDLGAREFSLRAMTHAGARPDHLPMVIEGVRHLVIREAIAEVVAPRPLYLVYIDATDEDRKHRLVARGSDPSLILSAENHVTEQDVVASLKDLADYWVTESDAVKACADIAAWLSSREQ